MRGETMRSEIKGRGKNEEDILYLVKKSEEHDDIHNLTLTTSRRVIQIIRKSTTKEEDLVVEKHEILAEIIVNSIEFLKLAEK